LAKKKIKNVQDNFKAANEPTKPYSQYFTFEHNESVSLDNVSGYTRSHDHQFQRLRKDRLDRRCFQTAQLLYRLDQLININADQSRQNKNKDRRSKTILFIHSFELVCLH
jgi:hypothetical protein